MKVVVCSNAYPPDFIGGAELIAHYQALALAKLGHSVVAFVADGQNSGPRYATTDDEVDGIAVRRIFVNYSNFGQEHVNFSNSRIDAEFRNFVIAQHPDVIHFHNLIGLSMGMVSVAREQRIPTVLTTHDNWGFCLRNTLVRPNGKQCTNPDECHICQPQIKTPSGIVVPIVCRKNFLSLMLSRIDWFVSPSQYQADRYLDVNLPPRAMQVVANGVDVNRFKNVVRTHSDRPRFTFIGYLGDHKGMRNLLWAAGHLPKGAVFLNVVGTGHELESYRNLAEAEGIADNVKFWGKLPNSQIPQVLSETDVLVLPSLWPENQPVSITEAMAAGIAVIATNAGGVPELVTHEETGLLVSLNNVSQLTHAMERYMQDPELATRHGEAGKAKIRNNTFAHAAQTLTRVYQRGRRLRRNENALIVGFRGQPDDQEYSAMDRVRRKFASRHGEVVFLPFEWVAQDSTVAVDFVICFENRAIGLEISMGGAWNPQAAGGPLKRIQLCEALRFQDSSEMEQMVTVLLARRDLLAGIGEVAQNSVDTA